MIRYVYEQEHPNNQHVNHNIKLAKSDSGCCGSELRTIHYHMGKQIGEVISKTIDIEDTVIMPLLTGAVPFAFGVGEIIDVKMLMIDSHNGHSFPSIHEKNIIIIDEVINTGKTVLEIADYYKAYHNIILATTVMPEDSEAFDSEYDIYTYRISKHRYKGTLVKKITGTEGPDTAARLYSLF